MRIKNGVSFRLLKPQMVIACPIIEEALFEVAPGKECVLTSGDEGKHKTGSLHPPGEALDFRTRHLTPQERLDWKLRCQQKLGDQYDVILSKKKGKVICLHVEWDL